MEAHWIEGTVGENGELVLNDLPFSAGESVEVLILPKGSPTADAAASLLGSVIEYRDPFDPVAVEDWDVLR